VVECFASLNQPIQLLFGVMGRVGLTLPWVSPFLPGSPFPQVSPVAIHIEARWASSMYAASSPNSIACLAFSDRLSQILFIKFNSMFL